MDRVVFAPIIDLPLVAITLGAFLWHFNQWAFRHDIGTTADLPSRLPAARLRVIVLFVCILLLCWTVNLAVWSIFAILLSLGFVIALAAGGDFDGWPFGLFAAAYFIREWAFGFPQIILHPPRSDSTSTVLQEGQGALLGKTGVTITSLRPRGDALINGGKHAVVSFDGGWIDADSRIEVKTYRNGLPCVGLLVPASEECEPPKE
jgi:hypothetical protein